ncbi:MAG: FxsA family protein [Fibrobacter sp.]|nr:FxsA family protein [Fibrobacter sp.]
MIARLLPLFAIISLTELMLLVKVGTYIGVLNTVLLVIITATIGVSIARYQGMQTLQRARQSLVERKIPANEVLDGFLILIAALFLITPGVLTDTTGFLLLIPASRHVVKMWLIKKIQNWINRGRGEIRVGRWNL